ncbi:hypothetical protein PG991_011755 [Apiospora marii]|uniref:Uncharacterized protein n=1 Tax=Apiospora marii TaxID=335849 RepID=A0ABR1RF22_9PEZI
MSQPRNIPPNRSCTGGDRVETPTTGQPSSRPRLPPSAAADLLLDEFDNDDNNHNNNETALGASPLSHIASQGGGFKDAPTARHTLTLIAHRSLLYQQQLVRTYQRRAQTHSRAATSPGMADAAAVFEEWQATTLPALRRQLRGRLPGANDTNSNSNSGFRPLVSRDLLSALVPRFERVENAPPPAGMKRDIKPFGWIAGERGCLAFLEAYLASSPRAKLGNLLVEASRGAAREEDWEAVRYAALDSLVEPGQETLAGWTEGRALVP